MRKSMDHTIADFKAKSSSLSTAMALAPKSAASAKLAKEFRTLRREFDDLVKDRVIAERQNPLDAHKVVETNNPLDTDQNLVGKDFEKEAKTDLQSQVQSQAQATIKRDPETEMVAQNRMATERAMALEQHREVNELAKNVNQVKDLYKDMAILIDQQGEELDHTEEVVEKANLKVERGVKELRSANEYQKRNRRLKCCIVIIVLAILAAILIPVLTTQLGKKKDTSSSDGK